MLPLASQSDAFTRQTGPLVDLTSTVRGEDVAEDTALGMEDVVITPAKASTRGWVTPPPDRFRLSGRDGAAILLPLLRQIGSLYARGARSSIAHLDLVDLEIAGGGRLWLSLESVPTASMKRLGELFETLAMVINAGAASEADLEISDPDEQCLFMQALRQASPRR